VILTLAIAAVPAFVASVVEWVEAFTIVLAVGNTRGWRSPLWGTAAALGTLAVIVTVFGTPLIIFHDQGTQSVIALGAQGGAALQAAILGAVAAFVVTTAAGAFLHKPPAFVPKNFMKFVVGAMLTTFGIFWGAEGLLVEWALGDATLLVILAGVCLVSLAAIRMLALVALQGARVAVRHL
jgi:uncharacterized membrane protein